MVCGRIYSGYMGEIMQTLAAKKFEVVELKIIEEF
jgi:hypothetical protein